MNRKGGNDLDREQNAAVEIAWMLNALRSNGIYIATGEYITIEEFGSIMTNVIKESVGCKEYDFNLYPGMNNDLGKENAYFIAADYVPMVKKIGDTEVFYRNLDNTFNDLFTHINEQSNGLTRQAVVVTKDWNAEMFIKWEKKIKEVQGKIDLRILLVRSRKASDICFQTNSIIKNVKLSQSAAKSKYGKYLGAALNVLMEVKPETSVKTEEMIEVMANLTRANKEEFKKHSYNNIISSDKEAFIFGLSNLRLGHESLDTVEYPYFTQALRRMITHAQGKYPHRLEDVVLMVDQWSSKEAEFWSHNINAISKEAHLEIFLLTGDTLNRIR